MLLIAFIFANLSRLVCCALVRYNLTLHSAIRSPDGFAREVYLVNGKQPGPLIEANEGDDLEIFVSNELTVENAIHWHGLFQSGTPYMDGTPGVSQAPIPAGGNLTYRFSLGRQYGFYWYHSHFRAYYDDAVRGPLLIHPNPMRLRPFDAISVNGEQLAKLVTAEEQAHNVVINDWTHELSDTTYARYNLTGAYPFCVDSILIQGKARIECLPSTILAAGPGLVDAMMEMGSSDRKRQMLLPSSTRMTSMRGPMASRGNMAVTPSSTVMAMQSLSPRGCTPYVMFRDGFNASSQLKDTCTNTIAALAVFPVNETTAWVGLNFVNAGSVSAVSLSIDSHSMWVYAVDGLYVNPREYMVLNINIGERYQVFVKPITNGTGNYYIRVATYPTGDMQQVLQSKAILSYEGLSTYSNDINVTQIGMQNWLLLNGSATNGATMSDASTLTPFLNEGVPDAPTRAANVTFNFMVSQTDVVTWAMDGVPYQEATIPIIEGNRSEGWSAKTTKYVPIDSLVDIIFQVANDSMEKMGHSIHLHGHKFWVLGGGTGPFVYNDTWSAPPDLINLSYPPYRDVALLPQSGWLAIRYVADNPGAWMLHCHMQWHLLSGMAVVLVEGQGQLPRLLAQAGSSATSTSVSSSIESSAAKIARGGIARQLPHLLMAIGWIVMQRI